VRALLVADVQVDFLPGGALRRDLLACGVSVLDRDMGE
jgi:hypothetical protein